MKKQEMKETISRYIRMYKNATYSDIESVFEANGFDYKGNVASSPKENQKVYFWLGWNQEAFDMLDELEKEGILHKEPTMVLTYIIGGKVPNMPTVKRPNIMYKTPHWLPVLFVYGRDTEKAKVGCTLS